MERLYTKPNTNSKQLPEPNLTPLQKGGNYLLSPLHSYFPFGWFLVCSRTISFKEWKDSLLDAPSIALTAKS